MDRHKQGLKFECTHHDRYYQKHMSRYIPPSKRQEVEDAKAKDPKEALNPANFPSLGLVGYSVAPKAAVPQNFLERIREAERRRAEEADDLSKVVEQANQKLRKEGWDILSVDPSTIKGVSESIFERYVEKGGLKND